MEPGLNPKDRREDKALARGLKAGKRGAWDRFYTLYAGPLFRFVVARSAEGKGRVEDIVQDVVVVAVERIGRYDPKRGSLWAWLCGIAVNKLRESARNVRRGGLLRQRLTAPLPSAPARSDESSSELFQALGSIHPRHQEVLSLKYMEGLSVRAIAKELGSSEKAVESRLSRAREAFRKEYRECRTQARKE